MRVGIVTESTEGGPASSVGNTINLVSSLREVACGDLELVLVDCSRSSHRMYEGAEELILPGASTRIPSSLRPTPIVSFISGQFADLVRDPSPQKRIRDARIDVLHHPDAGRHALPLRLAAMDDEVGLVVTNRGMAHLYLPPSECYGLTLSPRRLYHHIELLKWKCLLAQTPAVLIVPSESEKRNIRSSLPVPKDRICVVHNAMGDHYGLEDIKEARKDTKLAYGIDSPFILHASVYQPKEECVESN